MVMCLGRILHAVLLVRTHQYVIRFHLSLYRSANSNQDCVGVFQAYYENVTLRQYASSTIAWISSLMIFFMFFFGPIIGKLYDNYGPRWLLVGGTFLEVFGLMMLSLSTEYYQILLSQGICAALGASTMFYPAMSTITTWFFKKRGAAFGIIAAGSSLGGVILPIMVSWSFSNICVSCNCS